MLTKTARLPGKLFITTMLFYFFFYAGWIDSTTRLGMFAFSFLWGNNSRIHVFVQLSSHWIFTGKHYVNLRADCLANFMYDHEQ